MTAVGPNSPGTAADDSGTGTVSWSNPNNAKVSDSSNATAAMSSVGSTTFSHYLKVTNFGFAITAGSTVDGITVEIRRDYNVGGTAPKDNIVKLVNGSGTIVGSNKASATSWTTTMGYFTYGASNDTWSASLTDTDVNSSSFGVVLSIQEAAFSSCTANVDHIRITINYTAPSGTNWALTATVTGASAVGGSLNIDAAMVSTVTGVSSVSGTLNLQEVLTGSINGVSAIGGPLSIGKDLGSATITNASGITGGLNINAALASTITAVSAFTANLVVNKPLSALISAVSAFTASLYMEVVPVVNITNASSIGGSLGIDRAMVASIAGVSDITANLTVVANNRAPGIAGDNNQCD